MRTTFYIIAICFAVLLLFVTVDKVDSRRPLATLLMILIIGIVAAAVLIKAIP
jgi:multisubunit Na+/H+ antiporter MnhG subunit